MLSTDRDIGYGEAMRSPMPLASRLLCWIIRGLTRLLCRIRVNEIPTLPLHGPAILASNHSSNFEALIYYAYLAPRKRTAFGKRELWNNPVTRFVMQIWSIIPVRRGVADRGAFGRALRELGRGAYLGLAPEGTRSKSGVLSRGRPGVAILATAARIPVYPLACLGTNTIVAALRRGRRPEIAIRVGAPFVLELPTDSTRTSRDLRVATDEIMVRIAQLLPYELRGRYAGADPDAARFLRPWSANHDPRVPEYHPPCR